MRPLTRSELAALDEAIQPIQPEPFALTVRELLLYAAAGVAAIVASIFWPWGFA